MTQFRLDKPEDWGLPMCRPVSYLAETGKLTQWEEPLDAMILLSVSMLGKGDMRCSVT